MCIRNLSVLIFILFLTLNVAISLAEDTLDLRDMIGVRKALDLSINPKDKCKSIQSGSDICKKAEFFAKNYSKFSPIKIGTRNEEGVLFEKISANKNEVIMTFSFNYNEPYIESELLKIGNVSKKDFLDLFRKSSIEIMCHSLPKDSFINQGGIITQQYYFQDRTPYINIKIDHLACQGMNKCTSKNCSMAKEMAKQAKTKYEECKPNLIEFDVCKKARELADELSHQLPMKMSNELFIEKVFADKGMINLTAILGYDIDYLKSMASDNKVSLNDLKNSLKISTIKVVCQPKTPMAAFIKLGGGVKYEYQFKDRLPYTTIIVDKNSCELTK